MTSLLLPIVVLPLIGFLINGLLGNRFGKRFVSLVACGLPIAAFVIAIRATMELMSTGTPLVQTVFTWAQFADRSFEIAFYFDRLTAVMVLIVTGVGSLIHIYSTGYMHEDKSYARYFAYLNLFLFFMLMLVLGRSLLVLFVGWEGRGAGVVPADRLLVRGSRKGRCRQEGLHHQPRRRRRLPAGHVPAVPRARHAGDGPDQRRLPRRAGRGLCQPRRRISLHRRDRQVGTDSAARLAARCDGGSDAGVGADPCGDDGDRRRLPRCAAARHLPARARGVGTGRHDRCGHRVLRRDDRARADRHQEGAGVLDDLAARLHVPGRWSRGLRGRGVPPVHARLLQGVPVPRRRLA